MSAGIGSNILSKHAAVLNPLPPVSLQRSFTHPGPEQDDMVSEDGSNMESQFLTTVPQQAPFVPPMPPHSRRKRLLRIGTGSTIDRPSQGPAERHDTSRLLSNSTGDLNFYGTISSSGRGRYTIGRRKTIAGFPFGGFASNPPSPHQVRSRASFFVLNTPPAYDAPLEEEGTADSGEDNDAAKANGIRVW